MSAEQASAADIEGLSAEDIYSLQRAGKLDDLLRINPAAHVGWLPAPKPEPVTDK
jgi:hypothetical protein